MNKTTTAAMLSTDTPTAIKTPKLPEREGHEWNALTLKFWRDVWRSPMAPEFLQADVHGLFVLAELVDQFWANPDVKLAAEIRQQRQCFGLTPIDRRRLQWEVKRVEEGRRLPAKPKDEAKAARDEFDPRQLLTVVN